MLEEVPDFSGIKNEIDKTQNQFKKFQLNLSSGLKAIGKMAGITLGAKALVDFGKAAIKTSSDLEEIQNVTDTVFRSMSKDHPSYMILVSFHSNVLWLISYEK